MATLSLRITARVLSGVAIMMTLGGMYDASLPVPAGLMVLAGCIFCCLATKE